MRNFYYTRTIFFILFPILLFGQISQNDLTKLPYEELKKMFFDNQKDSSKQVIYAKAFLDKAKNEKDNRQIARGYYWFSLTFKNENDIIRCLDSAIKYSKDGNDLNFPAVAYCDKAFALRKKRNLKEAFNNYLLAEKYSLRNNLDYYYNVKYNIGVTKSEDLGEVTEALKMYKECYKYYKNKNYRDEKYSVQFQNTLFAIADSYKGLKQIDSATFYNKYGYKEAKITHNEDFLYLFILNEGANLVIKKNYKAALDSIKKALPKMIAFKDEGNVLASYYYLGKAYEGLGQKDIAVSNYVKVDSIYKKRGFITPEFIGGYSFLISYYKDKGNQKKQLEYLTTYTKIDSDLQRHYKQMYKLLVQQYDIPHLFKDKEALIKSLKKDWTFYYCLLAVILLTAISLGIYGFYQRNLNKTYRTRFEKIIADTKYLNTTPTKVELAIPEEITKSKPLVVADDMAIQLLKKLDAFVNERGYLKSNITLQSLSKELSTNSTYLSYIINQYKEKNLVAYLNDLRINDAVMSLQKNSDLKKYTIQALANEFGFNNAESFSNAFHRKTGLKPSFFIKELEKQ